ncbi:MAG: thioesterase family protein [Cyanobacteria bacterium P01_D01_bin.105]
MPFVYRRVIRFHETDAAGVVYFASLLSLCHEAYEAAIASTSTLNPQQFFSGAEATAVPIVHTAADFYQPLFCGDEIAITLTPKQLTSHSFEINYVVSKVAMSNADRLQPNSNQPNSHQPDKLLQALTRHVCIATDTRRRSALPSALLSWIADLSVPDAVSEPEPEAGLLEPGD